MSNPGNPRLPALAHLRFQAEAQRLLELDLQARFAKIYATNLWGGESTRSGVGSTLDETALIRRQIPLLLHELGARTLLDLPCGDFAWMARTDLGGVDYTGADIVPDVIAENNARYAGPHRRFLHLDLTRDPLPPADVVLCRDCPVHLSFDNIFRALANIRGSGAKYLLATTFTGDAIVNEDIVDGDWRLLNFQLPPFSLPPPLALIVEGCTEQAGAFADKALGLWRVQ